MKKYGFLFYIIILFFLVVSSFAKDFIEPISIIDPLGASKDSENTFLPSMYGSFSYTNYFILHDIYDSFYFRLESGSTLWRYKDKFAIGMRFGSTLLSGPVDEDEEAASVAEFWMNAIQYEYGFYGSYNLLDLNILFEYSRTSQHVLRSEFSEISSDNIKTGIVYPKFEFKGFYIERYFRTGYMGLFEFWAIDIPEPKIKWYFSPAARIQYIINKNVSVYTWLVLETGIPRHGDFTTNINNETGIILGNGNNRILFYFEIYKTGDSEILDNYVHPTTEIGMGFRTSFGEDWE